MSALYGIGQRLPNNRGYEYHALAAVQAFPEGGCETRWGSVRPHKPRLDLYGRQHGEWDGRMQFMASSKTKHKHCLT
jgi:hypothetical protein